jgi:outer membrane protein OmpA-like peptidoglycan-associated protein
MVESLAAKLRQSGFASQLFDLINSPANDLQALENPRSLVGSPPSAGIASKFMPMLFGGKLSALTDEIGSATGIRGGTAASLMTLGVPLLLGTLRKRISDGRMDSSGLTSLLATEANSLHGSLPQRVENLITSEMHTAGTAAQAASSAVQERSRSWLWPLLLGILLLVGVLVWWMSSQKTAVETASTELNALITHRLPNNIDLRYPVNQVEDKLLRFIEDPARPVDQTSWFEFNRLLFDTNSATLQPGSAEELSNIGAILKAYPNVRVKIGGFTDSSGDAAANMVLSQQRADGVKQQLTGMGISADRIEAQGYGDQYPVANNATEAGREKNRHAALLVTQK